MAASKTKALVKDLLKATDEMKAAFSIYWSALEDANEAVGAHTQAIRFREKVDVDALLKKAQADKDNAKKLATVFVTKSKALTAATAALQARLVEKKKVKNPFKKLNVDKAQKVLDNVAAINSKLDLKKIQGCEQDLKDLLWFDNDIIEFRKTTNEIFAGLTDDE